MKLGQMAEDNGLRNDDTGTLTRLKGQKRNESVLGMKVLLWVLYLERRLGAGELRCLGGGDTVYGSGSGEHSCVMDTPIVLSRSCHSRASLPTLY